MAKSAGIQKKYGPLPLWGWVAVGAAGYFVWRHYSATKQSGGDPQAQPGGFSGQMGSGGGKHRKRR